MDTPWAGGLTSRSCAERVVKMNPNAVILKIDLPPQTFFEIFDELRPIFSSVWEADTRQQET